MKVRLCEHNDGSKKVLKALTADAPSLNIKRKECIKECKRCRKGPFALLDGVRIDAETTEELISLVKGRIVLAGEHDRSR